MEEDERGGKGWNLQSGAARGRKRVGDEMRGGERRKHARTLSRVAGGAFGEAACPTARQRDGKLGRKDRNTYHLFSSVCHIASPGWES